MGGFFIKCKKCGQSLDKHSSVWRAEVRWPVKLRFDENGLSYMVAKLEDEAVIGLIDWSGLTCDACDSQEVELTAEDEKPGKKN